MKIGMWRALCTSAMEAQPACSWQSLPGHCIESPIVGHGLPTVAQVAKDSSGCPEYHKASWHCLQCATEYIMT